MKKVLVVATLSIAVAAVIKRVTKKNNCSITAGYVDSYSKWVVRELLNSDVISSHHLNRDCVSLDKKEVGNYLSSKSSELIL